MTKRCLLNLLVFAACTTDVPDTEPTSELDPAVDEPDLGPPVTEAELANVPDGTTGWARVQTPHGVELLPYVAYGGMAVYQDDMVLGPVAKVDARLRGGALTSTGARWTDNNNLVQWAFSANFTSNADRTVVRDAMAELEATLPIDFQEVDLGDHTGPWIELGWGPEDSWYTGMSTSIGMVGCGEIHCSPHNYCRSDCGQWIYFDPAPDEGQPTKRTTKHEVLHALGMYHEQARNDRDAYVKFRPECTMQDEQFVKQSTSLDLGPYDFKSIMHYSSWSACTKDATNDGDPYYDGCACLPLTRKTDALNDGDNLLDPIPARSNLSVEDINTLWRGYNEALATNNAGDDFGRALAVGDFDGDGYDDVAVGAPKNSYINAGEAGAVFLFKGTSSRLVPWRTITQAQLAGQAPEPGDHFGAALAAGDIDGDGKAELLIGAPDEDTDPMYALPAANSGLVHLFLGSSTGPVYHRALSQQDYHLSQNEPDAQFGAAIAIGSLTATNRREILIGAPGDLVTGQFTNARSGAVYIFHDDLTSWNGGDYRPTRLAFGFGQPGDRFGAAIAVGKIDLDAYEDVVIGSPGANRVTIYAGRKPPESNIESWSAMALFRQAFSTPADGDRFGAAVLIANVWGTMMGEVVVGAPGTDNDVGRAYVYNLTAPELTTNTMALTTTIYSNGGQEPGDEFGASLAAFQRDSATSQLDLVIGSPGENGDQGIITLYRGEQSAIVAVANVFQSTIALQLPEAGDRFGATLAVGQLDGAGDNGSSDDLTNANLRKVDLVVGATGETIGYPSGGPAAGAFGLFLQASGGSMVGARSYDQQTQTRD